MDWCHCKSSEQCMFAQPITSAIEASHSRAHHEHYRLARAQNSKTHVSKTVKTIYRNAFGHALESSLPRLICQHAPLCSEGHARGTYRDTTVASAILRCNGAIWQFKLSSNILIQEDVAKPRLGQIKTIFNCSTKQTRLPWGRLRRDRSTQSTTFFGACMCWACTHPTSVSGPSVPVYYF
jgi:hypothetical protein